MPNKLKDAVRHKFSKKNYNQRDWKAYDQTLVNQGSITIWFDEEAVSQWNQVKPLKLPRGRPRLYSELAIQTCHTLRFLNKKALRQTQGFVVSIIAMLKLPLQTPDHTTLSRRLQTIKIPRKAPKKKPGDHSRSAGSLIVIVDSSGLKVMGEKEWMNYKYDTRQRKVWRKLHIAVDETGEIIAHELTTHITGDSATVEALLAQIEQPISEFIGDGGYDHPPTYSALKTHSESHLQVEPTIIIPPNIGFKGVTEDDPGSRRNNQRVIEEQGRERWQKQTDYGRRGVSENTFWRYKAIIGNKINSRNDAAQKNEVHIGILILNKFHKMGMPKLKVA